MSNATTTAPQNISVIQPFTLGPTPGQYLVSGQVNLQTFDNNVSVPMILALSTDSQSFTDLSGNSYDATTLYSESMYGMVNYDLPIAISAAGGPYSLSMMTYSVVAPSSTAATLYLLVGYNSTVLLKNVMYTHGGNAAPYTGN